MTSDKNKIRDKIREQKQLLLDLQKQESDLKWNINREAKLMQKKKVNEKEKDDIQRYKEQTKQNESF